MQNVIQPGSKPDSPISTNSNSGLQRWDKKLHSQTRYPKEAKSDPKGDKVTQLMPRFASQGFQEGTRSPNWSPNWSHKAPQGSQEATQDTQEAQMGPTWLQEDLLRHPKRHPKWAQTQKVGPHGKNYVESHYSHEEIALFNPKNIKNTSFLPSRGRSFLVLFLKIIKNTNVWHTFAL